MSKSVIKTYVWHGEKCFFVSTINRECGAAAAPELRYNETMVWECDPKTYERQPNFLLQAEDTRGRIVVHQNVVETLHRFGAEGLKGWNGSED